ncbi:hypothetical protein EYF80_062473 [Liparis tanakae]|uniref:Uncharacterized protein n=1 Tax=Liparis tanakae TaxID=230148 RepID=A0A4Z2EFZ3_9TELE|nr:hypothetical protein EYF80_062473 [Liparis tanakae]
MASPQNRRPAAQMLAGETRVGGGAVGEEVTAASGSHGHRKRKNREEPAQERLPAPREESGTRKRRVQIECWNDGLWI